MVALQNKRDFFLNSNENIQIFVLMMGIRGKVGNPRDRGFNQRASREGCMG